MTNTWNIPRQNIPFNELSKSTREDLVTTPT